MSNHVDLQLSIPEIRTLFSWYERAHKKGLKISDLSEGVKNPSLLSRSVSALTGQRGAMLDASGYCFGVHDSSVNLPDLPLNQFILNTQTCKPADFSPENGRVFQECGELSIFPEWSEVDKFARIQIFNDVYLVELFEAEDHDSQLIARQGMQVMPAVGVLQMMLAYYPEENDDLFDGLKIRCLDRISRNTHCVVSWNKGKIQLLEMRDNFVAKNMFMLGYTPLVVTA